MPKLEFLKARIIFCLCWALPIPVAAQDPPKRAQLEEVIVTAQKREQNLQDVPMAITALGRELLDQHEIDDLSTMTELVPSLHINEVDGPQNTSIKIRGVGSFSASPSVEPGVSVVVDGVPLARTEVASLEFADIERVEVLRGPQGTLFGKNSTAGVVHIITRDPAPEFEAFVRYTYEEAQDLPGFLQKGQFGFSGPVTSSLGVRFSGFYKEEEGPYEDVLQNETAPDKRSYGARMKWRWEPLDALSAKLILEHQEQDGTANPVTFRSANPNVRENRDFEIDKENNKTRTFGTNLSDLENTGVSLSVDWDLGAVILSSITGWRDFETRFNLGIPDLTGDRLDVERSGGIRKFETFTQELQLTSDTGGNFEYTVGALWFDNRLNDLQDALVSDIPSELIVGAVTPPGSPFPDIEGIDTVPGESFAISIRQPSRVDIENLGIYGQATWHFFDRWHLTGGARYIDEKVTASTRSFERTIQEGTEVTIEAQEVVPATSIEDEKVIGTLSLQYDWSEAVRVYSTVSTGYRGGTFDLRANDLQKAFDNPVEAETAFNTEAGVKSRLFDDRLELNIAVYRTVFEDFQVQVLKPGEGDEVVPQTQQQLNNAGELETRGVEVDFKAQLGSLSLFGALLYNKAEFNEYVGSCFAGQQPGESGGRDVNGDGTCDEQDLAGKSLANAPELSGNISARYERPVIGGQGYVQLGARYKDEAQADNLQNPFAIVEAYSVWDLRIGWYGLDQRLEVAGFVKNLFDEFWINNISPITAVNDRRDAFHFFSRHADRTLGVSVGYDW